jgi:hypothetical protein
MAFCSGWRRWRASAPTRRRSALRLRTGARETIHLGRRTLRVVGVRDDDADRPPVLIVEDLTD